MGLRKRTTTAKTETTPKRKRAVKPTVKATSPKPTANHEFADAARPKHEYLDDQPAA